MIAIEERLRHTLEAMAGESPGAAVLRSDARRRIALRKAMVALLTGASLVVVVLAASSLMDRGAALPKDRGVGPASHTTSGNFVIPPEGTREQWVNTWANDLNYDIHYDIYVTAFSPDGRQVCMNYWFIHFFNEGLDGTGACAEFASDEPFAVFSHARGPISAFGFVREPVEDLDFLDGDGEMQKNEFPAWRDRGVIIEGELVIRSGPFIDSDLEELADEDGSPSGAQGEDGRPSIRFFEVPRSWGDVTIIARDAKGNEVARYEVDA